MKIVMFFWAFVFSQLVFSQTEKTMPIDEIQSVLQVALDLPALQEYFHLEADASRRPLIIQEHELINAANLKGIYKFGEAINVLSQEDIKKKQVGAYLEISEWMYSESDFTLQWVYDIEGVRVDYVFKKNNGRWNLLEAILVEF